MDTMNRSLFREGPEGRNGEGGDSMPSPIEATPPEDWRALERKVAQIVEECGYEVDSPKTVDLARGSVEVDVWVDEGSSPPNIMIFECKHWKDPVNKNVVHGFRTVVGDSGANCGFIVSLGDFQKGAVEAAAYSNVRLLNWDSFQQMFVHRWFRSFMVPRLTDEAVALIEYTEPINSRVDRKATALTQGRREQFMALQRQYQPLSYASILYRTTSFFSSLSPLPRDWVPSLPLIDSPGPHAPEALVGLMPADVQDATALRPLMEALIAHYRQATAEFDEVFGERA